jgi:hypothetical protein
MRYEAAIKYVLEHKFKKPELATTFHPKETGDTFRETNGIAKIISLKKYIIA